MKQSAYRVVQLMLILIVGYYAIWGGEYTAWDLRRLHHDIEEERQELAVTRAAVDSLQAYSALLEGDLPTLERIARERFGMVSEGEVLYRFMPMDSSEAAAGMP